MLPLPVGPVAWTEASGQMSKARGLASLVASVMNAFLIVDGISLADPSNNFINKVRELHAALRAVLSTAELGTRAHDHLRSVEL